MRCQELIASLISKFMIKIGTNICATGKGDDGSSDAGNDASMMKPLLLILMHLGYMKCIEDRKVVGGSE